MIDSLSGVPSPIISAMENRLKTLKNGHEIEGVKLSADMVKLIQALAETMHASPSQVISRAVSLLFFAVEAKEKEYELGIVRKEDAHLLETKIGLN